jgi:endonuclease/exonuclease/phosphatase family metal-dependent hydrolase
MIVTMVLLNLSMNEERGMAQTSSELTIMSYNIRYDNPDDGINAWPNRKDHVAEMMTDVYSADIIGVQEALKHQLDDLQAKMPGYSWVGVGRDDGKDQGEFSPIFYNTDRFDLIATNTFWLSETPDRPGSRSWDAAITRIATWAKLSDRESGQEFYVINTHFDHRGEVARKESARLITEFVEGLDEDIPVLLTGDFNVTEESEAYAVLADSPILNDARYLSEEGHEGPTATFNDWETLQPEESRIDYIFVNSHVSVLSHKIADDRYEGRFPSDHLPVIARVEM